VIVAGLQRVLPLALGLTFLVLPSTSTRAFRTFLCEKIIYHDPSETRRYLAADLALSCESDEYEITRRVAISMLVLWPVLTPLLYTVLLWASRDAFRTGVSTSLSRTTAFLYGDYRADVGIIFMWEPLEMCRKLVLCGWVLSINEDAEQARVVVALFTSITFFGLNLRFRPLRRVDDSALTTLSHLALILVYSCTMAIKTCDLSPKVCSRYGFGDSAKGFFLFFIFFGLAMLGFQLVFEFMALLYHTRRQSKLRRLRYRGGYFVELPPLSDQDFVHLPGLTQSMCYHLFLSHAWPLGQDVCKLIKQRCREICPSMHVFLDVEDLTSGSGTKEVDHSQCILVFAMAVYFQKINCVKELTRAIVRRKPITLLLPDAEVHGEFTEAMIREIVTDEWLRRWKLQKKLAEWSNDWGLKEAIRAPTAADICDDLFKQPPLEWSRITPFQDRMMVLMCQRLLPEAKRNIYLQGSVMFKLRQGHLTVKVYCSPHNPGARELADELNSSWPGLLQVADVQSWSDLQSCDHMLVYLTAVTWMHSPELLAAELREALRQGLHLQPCHEFPSALDSGSARAALEFKEIMDATPADLKKGPTNIYSQIAVSLKGGELREPGLANLALRLSARAKPVPGLVRQRSLPKSIDAQRSPLLSRAVTLRRLCATKLRKVRLGVHRISGGESSQADVNIGAVQPGYLQMFVRRDSSKLIVDCASSVLEPSTPYRAGSRLERLSSMGPSSPSISGRKSRKTRKSTSQTAIPVASRNIPKSRKSTSTSDVAVAAERPTSFRDDSPSFKASKVVVDNTPTASAAGVLEIESSV